MYNRGPMEIWDDGDLAGKAGWLAKMGREKGGCANLGLLGAVQKAVYTASDKPNDALPLVGRGRPATNGDRGVGIYFFTGRVQHCLDCTRS